MLFFFFEDLAQVSFVFSRLIHFITCNCKYKFHYIKSSLSLSCLLLRHLHQRLVRQKAVCLSCAHNCRCSSLTYAVSAYVDKPLKSVMHGQCDVRPSQPQSITAASSTAHLISDSVLVLRDTVVGFFLCCLSALEVFFGSTTL